MRWRGWEITVAADFPAGALFCFTKRFWPFRGRPDYHSHRSTNSLASFELSPARSSARAESIGSLRVSDRIPTTESREARVETRGGVSLVSHCKQRTRPASWNRRSASVSLAWHLQ